MNFTLVAGARPNFMKIAPIIHTLNRIKPESGIDCRLIHTGQHYDQKMSETFFQELNIPEPDSNLGCGGGTQAEQTIIRATRGLLVIFPVHPRTFKVIQSLRLTFPPSLISSNLSATTNSTTS
jgi:UDP-N-acetylglucosamine 2-epimerase